MALTLDGLVRLELLDEEPRISPALLARLKTGLERPGPIVVLEGRGGQFCEGLDLRAFNDEAGSLAFAALLEALCLTPRPVIALVDGPALGGGCALAAVADLVLATPRATFGLPEVFWGLSPAIALRYVARRVGVARARLLGLGLAPLDATQAHGWGLVDFVVPDLSAALAAHSKRFLRADPRAIGEVKRLAASLVRDEAYEAPALAKFHGLARSEATKARVAKFLAGEVPWPEVSRGDEE